MIGKKEIPFEYEDIAIETHQTKEFVEYALKILEEVELVEFVNDHYYIEKSLELTNQTTEGAEYMRSYRSRKKEEDYICKEKCKTDKEIELENKNKKEEVEIDKEEYANFSYREVINYLNDLLGSNYREDSDLIRKLMNVHIRNGYTENDFKDVIYRKYKEWKDTERRKYIRPETLFGEKFETYLNQIESEEEKRYNGIDFDKLYAN